MLSLLSVIWNPDPVAFSLGSIEVRWYGIIYATGFLFAIWLLGKMLKSEGCPDEWADKIFIYTVIATIVGSRLGHVFFYDWDYYKDHIGEIFQIWKGGLASHGGAIAIIFTVWLLAKYLCKRSFCWLADRMFVVCCSVAVLIRLGNLMNSEIYGCVTDLPWGFKFVRDYPGVPIDRIPVCHPTQIYESLAYLVLFGILMWMYWRTDARKREGLIMGTGFAVMFIMRFLIEFIKNDQSEFEAGMIINMGQILSIPMILFGLYFIIRAFVRPKSA